MPLLRTFQPSSSRFLPGQDAAQTRTVKSTAKKPAAARFLPPADAAKTTARKKTTAPVVRTKAATTTRPAADTKLPSNAFDQGAADAAVAQANETRLAALRAERLEAALAAIGAQFNFQEGGLEGQQRELESLFEALIAANSRDTRNTTRAIEGNAANRGLGRSGIFAQNLAEGLAPLAEERADVVGRLNPEEGAEGTEIRSIMSALALLGQQRASAEASAKLEAEQGELDIAQLVALVGAGLQ